MLIECGKCGAPLDVREGRAIATCNYCRSSNAVRTTRTLATQTPLGWKPPPTWTPPEGASVPPSQLVYRRRGAGGAALVMAGVGVVAAGGIAATVAVLSPTATPTSLEGVVASRPRSPVAALRAVEVATTPAALAAHFGPSARPFDQDSMSVDLEGDRWTRITFTWNAERDHLTRVTLGRDDASPASSSIPAALESRFSPRVARQSGGSFTADAAGGGSIYVSEDGSSVTLDASPERFGADVDWRPQVRVLWMVLRADVIGLDVPVNDADRELLAGYSLSRLSGIDPNVAVDGALAHVRSIVPAITSSQTIDLEMLIPIDHPWFGVADIDWKNEPNGQLTSLALWRHDRSALHSQDEIATCLTPLLGEPEIDVVDHLAQRRYFRWGYFAGPEFTQMTENHIAFGIPPGERGRTRFRGILTTLGSCGAPPAL